jgi:hypothetical protein
MKKTIKIVLDDSNKDDVELLRRIDLYKQQYKCSYEVAVRMVLNTFFFNI